jgi:hypothetical protein
MMLSLDGISPVVMATTLIVEYVHGGASAADIKAAADLFDRLSAFLDAQDVTRAQVTIALHTQLVSMSAESVGLDAGDIDQLEFLRRAIRLVQHEEGLPS